MSEDDIDLSGLMVSDNIADEGAKVLPAEPEYDFAPVEPAPPMFSADRQKKIMLIKKWIATFPQELKSFQNKDLEMLSDSELVSLQEEIDYTVRSSGDFDIGVSAMQGAIAAGEKVLVDYDLLKVQGLSKICTDPQVIRDMKYISLKHFGSVDVAPEARLTLKIVGTAMMLHNANTELEAQKEKATSNPELSQKVSNLKQKYADL